MKNRTILSRVGRLLLPAFWMVLAFGAVAVAIRFVVTATYPFGGWEYHAIFSDWSGGRISTAVTVYAEYVGTGMVFAFLLALCRYPIHWLAAAAAASLPPWWAWWQICWFPYQGPAFHRFALAVLLPIPLFVLLGGAAGILLRGYIGLWWRRREQSPPPSP